MTGVPLSVRVNRLFSLAHELDGPEPGEDAVAAGVSRILGRPVAPSEIESLRTNDHEPPEPDVLRAVAQHFHAPEQYLAADGYHDYDTLVRFKIAVREAGVRHLSMRSLDADAEPTTAEMESLIPLLENLRQSHGPLPLASPDPGQT
ncbi:hypothetical protein [Rhodococcus opacus]|uniref:Uncharacterized protein n=1 Tax=Rhodococcus opacus (strain B4) TaxID=632772 RepID=C1AWK6_RHOOB|nr:hypothetical protein [Rhodococcus opacus]BAH53779.1 hypothetical protein ROP_55320 [Rhodococcus opacus B4]